MSRRVYQGGSSINKGPRRAMREQDDEPPREAEVRLLVSKLADLG